MKGIKEDTLKEKQKELETMILAVEKEEKKASELIHMHTAEKMGLKVELLELRKNLEAIELLIEECEEISTHAVSKK